MNNKEWYKQAKFGMFIHWGLYSIPAGEWKGQRTDKPAEWLMTYYKIPIKEYEQLAKDIEALETEKKELTSKLEQQLDYQELEKIGNRISEITDLIDEKEMRWLELDEI